MIKSILKRLCPELLHLGAVNLLFDGYISLEVDWYKGLVLSNHFVQKSGGGRDEIFVCLLLPVPKLLFSTNLSHRHWSRQNFLSMDYSSIAYYARMVTFQVSLSRMLNDRHYVY